MGGRGRPVGRWQVGGRRAVGGRGWSLRKPRRRRRGTVTLQPGLPKTPAPATHRRLQPRPREVRAGPGATSLQPEPAWSATGEPGRLDGADEALRSSSRTHGRGYRGRRSIQSSSALPASTTRPAGMPLTPAGGRSRVDSGRRSVCQAPLPVPGSRSPPPWRATLAAREPKARLCPRPPGARLRRQTRFPRAQ